METIANWELRGQHLGTTRDNLEAPPAERTPALWAANDHFWQADIMWPNFNITRSTHIIK